METAMSNFLRAKLICSVPPALCLIAVVSAVVACEVPVFRYALERWNPDQYRLLVIADGPLDNNHLMALKRLEGTPESPAAAAIKIHDVSKSKDAFVQKLWKTHGNGARPVMVALYPERSSVDPEQVAFTSDLSDIWSVLRHGRRSCEECQRDIRPSGSSWNPAMPKKIRQL